jgi:hypothetical protein
MVIVLLHDRKFLVGLGKILLRGRGHHIGQPVDGDANGRLPVTRVVPDGNSHLGLSGIAFGMKNRLAVINGETPSPGESATIQLKPGTPTLKCLKIEKSSVLISTDGEDQPRILRLEH